MASGGKRGGAGDRVLEGRHVIGLFCLMLLFSGVFFTLGYVMGKSQFDNQVRAANPSLSGDSALIRKKDSGGRRAADPGSSPAGPDATTPPYPEWEFYHAGEVKKAEDHLKPAAPASTPKALGTASKGAPPTRISPSSGKPALNTPSVAGGAYVLQVAAFRRESDAISLAANLQNKKFPAFVAAPNRDKFYRVRVGPYANLKSADAAKKGLESAGFRGIVKH